MSEESAAAELLDRVYTQLHRVAVSRMAGQPPGHTLQATALVHEAWIRMSRDPNADWRDTRHFFATAAEAMRQILIDKARRRLAIRHGGELRRVDFFAVPITTPARDQTLIDVHEALEALARQDPEKAEIVKLRFFVGMTTRETAAALGITERTVERHWSYAKAWLFERIGAD